MRADFSLFDVALRTRQGVDLSKAPFDRYREKIASPSRYDAPQRLGRQMRADGVECFRYPSAPRPRGRAENLAAFTPRVFGSGRPGTAEVWHSVAERDSVEFIRKDLLETRALRFPRSDFEVSGRLPAPAL